MAKRTFYLPERKPPFAAWFATVDITDWLGSETIQTATFTASRKDTGADVTTTVIDTTKCTTVGSILKIWIMAGTTGIDYKVLISVTTTAGAKEQFAVHFGVEDL
jgi:hypothetical protein